MRVSGGLGLSLNTSPAGGDVPREVVLELVFFFPIVAANKRTRRARRLFWRRARLGSDVQIGGKVALGMH